MDPYHHAKFHQDMITPFRPEICENARLVTRLVFLVLPSAYSQDPCTDLHDRYVKWRRFAQGCTLILTPIPPKTQIFGQFSTGLRKFRVKKALRMGMLGSKLPLIVIVAPQKLYSDRHIGVEDSKYGVTADPLLTDREGVTWPTFEMFGPLHILRTVCANNVRFGHQHH